MWRPLVDTDLVPHRNSLPLRWINYQMMVILVSMQVHWTNSVGEIIHQPFLKVIPQYKVLRKKVRILSLTSQIPTFKVISVTLLRGEVPFPPVEDQI
jgi:hypothetical protein